MATIVNNKGKLCVNFMIFDEETNKKVRRRVSTGLDDTPENRKLATTKILPKIEKQILNGEYVVPKKQVSLDTLFKEWENKTKEEDRMRSYTLTDYSNAYKDKLSEKWGNKAIASFSEEDINDMQRDLLQVVGIKRAKSLMAPIRGVFKLAVTKRLIDVNPCDKANVINDLGKKQERIKDMQDLASTTNVEDFEEKFDSIKKDKKNPFSEKELKLIFETATGQFKNIFALMYFLGGLRPSELIALEWRHINFDKRVVYVVNGITGKESEKEKLLLKTDSSMRKVYLSDKAIELLQEQHKLTGFSSFVFLNQQKEQYNSPRYLSSKFSKLLDKLNLKNHKLYDIRHSYASVNLSKNRLPITFISQQMGHADIKTTLQKYSAYIADDQKEINDMLNSAFQSFNY